MLGNTIWAQLAGVARRIPAGSTLYVMMQRARTGDPEAVQYLKQHGIFDALDILHPGAGTAASVIKRHMDMVRGDKGPQEREDGYPWEGFANRLLKQPNSAQIILGPTGSGKTTFAKKLAWRLKEALGYQVEVCNLYGEDKPPFAKTVSTDTLIARMKQLVKHLKSLEDESEDAEEGSKEQKFIPAPAPKRIIIIDEASLAMSSNAQDPARRAALQALWQTRHLKWHVLYLAQMASQLPTQLWGQCVVWTKEPAGREADTDRDNPVVRAFWAEATERFRYIKQSEFWTTPYDNAKSWAFCDCQSLNGHGGYVGMMPWSPYNPSDEDGGDD